MRKRRVAALAAAAAVPGLMLVGQPTPAAAENPSAAECTAASVITGVTLLGNMPKCTTGPVDCHDEAGCYFTARMEGRTATAVGPTRCRLRIKDMDTGQIVDFYSSGGPTRCNVIQPSTFVPYGTTYSATCSYTRANVGVLATITCSARMEGLSGGGEG